MSYDLAALMALLDQAPDVSEKRQISASDYSNLMGLLQAPAMLRAPDGEGMTSTERTRKRRAIKKKRSIDNIAILDFETEPFDNVRKTEIFPFLAVLYSDNFEPVVIWDEDPDAFVNKVIFEITNLPEEYTIYAHNGGKFDYMFLIKKLRGEVMFKGRGLMTAKIGKHELRDSFHIIPDKLANFKKDHIDYKKMRRKTRAKYRETIIDYCISDCRYLLDIVKSFARRFGMKISIGQAAIATLRKHYKFETVTETTDAFIRQWYFGGRVECLAGKGHFTGDYKLYDVNSMYPEAMANYRHPIGATYLNHTGEINDNTFFLDLTCDSAGAFVMKDDNGATSAPHGRNRFKTTIYEYRVAQKYGLIKNVKIHSVIDCALSTKFDKFILPLYSERQVVKERLKEMSEGSELYDELKKDDIFLKLLLNNAYGKFCSNPRKYKEHYITDPDGVPEGEGWGDFPEYGLDDYWIWTRPSPEHRFLNVGTGATITGASRAILLEAICNSKGAIYCDTDSLICKELTGVKIHKSDLGAWDLEAELKSVIINGKKLYSYEKANGKINIKSKGASQIIDIEQLPILEKLAEKERQEKETEFGWKNMLAMLEGKTITTRAKGSTLTKDGRQYYMERQISTTAKETNYA